MALRPAAGLVGRDRELAVIGELLRALRRGAATTLLVEGEAGIGKTRLVEALTDLAHGEGLTVFHGNAHPFERTRPFGAVADALELRRRSADPLRSAIAGLLVGGTQGRTVVDGTADLRYRVVEEVVDLVETACAETPVVLILEDLHWADDSSLLAFRSIAHGLSHVPLLLVGTLRPAPRSRELDELFDECASAGARVVSLRSLLAHDVEALVQAQLGLPPGPLLTSILVKAGGNPLWLVEILRSLSIEGWLRRSSEFAEATADELPGSLRDLVLRRLGYLPTRTLDLLKAASVLGDAVSVHDLAAVRRRPATEVVADLEEAFRSRLLDEHRDAVVFRHQLVQQAVYEDLPVPARRALHREAAGALAEVGADLSTVASHLIRGADRGDLEAVRWLRQAAAQAAARAPSVTVDLLRPAVALLPLGHPDTDLVTAELAEALQRAGQVAEASTVAEEVLDRPHRAEADVPLRLTLVSALSLQNRAPELIDRAESALQSSVLRPPDQALVLTQASYGRTFSGDFVGGEETARRALDIAERAGSVEMTVWGLAALSVAVKTQGRYAEALESTHRALALTFDPVDDGARLRHPHFFQGMALADSDRFGEARPAYLRAIEESRELGSAWLLPDMFLLAAEERFLVGAWDDAAAELESGVRLAQQHGQRISINQSRAYQAVMAIARGDVAGARSALADVDEQLTADQPSYGVEMVGFAASMLAEAEDEPVRAHGVLLRCWNRDVEREIRYYHRYLAPPLVRLSLALDQADLARRVVEAVEAGAILAPDVVSVQAAAQRCRGLLDDDPAPLLQAVELARRSTRLLDHAGACEDAASVVARSGQEQGAKDLLSEAQSRYDTVDATAWLARVGAGLRRLGVRQGARGPRRRPDTGWDSLTPSESAVSRLVAEGLTNREVGRRLHISPHTVNTHLRHVFQKLSVSTRAELAGKVARGSAEGIEITHSRDVSPGADVEAGS
jgi:DNA-binding CsgD family transcriptional regulator